MFVILFIIRISPLPITITQIRTSLVLPPLHLIILHSIIKLLLFFLINQIKFIIGLRGGELIFHFENWILINSDYFGMFHLFTKAINLSNISKNTLFYSSKIYCFSLLNNLSFSSNS